MTERRVRSDAVLALFTLGAIVSRQEGIGFIRAVGRGLRSAFSWVFWFLPLSGAQRERCGRAAG
jgi:hypothetical protein